MPDDRTPAEMPDFGYGRREAPDSLNPVDAAIVTRRSVRAFLPDKPVPRDLLEHILNISARAASGTNIQPWKVRAIAGAVKDEFCADVRAFRETCPEGEAEYAFYPTEWRDPYISRRRKLGWELYGLLGIGKGEREKTWAQHGRNFLFFDAPVGLIFTLDRDMVTGGYMDLALFMQNIMISARGHGLDTCPQAAWMEYPNAVARALDIPEDETVVCGMALGYEDTSKIENTLVTEREPLEVFAKFEGF